MWIIHWTFKFLRTFNVLKSLNYFFVFQNLTTSFRQFDTDQDGVVTLHYEQFVGLVFSIKS